MQIDREAVGVAGFGHQFLRAGDVGRWVGVQLFGPAVHEGRHGHARGQRLAAHHHLLDGVTVGRQVHRFAHHGVGEGVAIDTGGLQLFRPHVVGEEDHAVFRAKLDLHTIGLLQPLDILHRHILHDVDLARQQGGDAGRGLGNRGVDDLGDLGRVTPVAVEHFQHGAHFGVTLDQRVGAGAVGVAHGEVFFPGGEILRGQGVIRFGPARDMMKVLVRFCT